MSNFFQYKFENPNAEPKYKLKEDFSGNVIAIPTIFSHKPRPTKRVASERREQNAARKKVSSKGDKSTAQNF